MPITSASLQTREHTDGGFLGDPKNSRTLAGRALLAWGFAVATISLSISSLRAPEPLPADAPPVSFSALRAIAHVQAIASTPHPIGTPEHDVVRDYLVSQLGTLDLKAQVIRAVGVHTSNAGVDIGMTQNILCRLPGTGNSKAVMLVAHYDSVYRAPGAADDGAGVAAIMETARALRAGPPLKNDVIFLFTDGEEPGLLGSDAIATLPWLHDVGLIMNFEARGNQGPSLLFETGPKNSDLIATVATAVPHAAGSSLFYSLYKLLPNDTDFSVFRQKDIAGLNFAFGENLDAYHSPLDSARNLSLASLQHHGSYALELTRAFGGMDLTKTGSGKDDAVFFDWFGTHMVYYREFWIIPFQCAATIVLLLLIVLWVRRTGARPVKILTALPFCATFLIVIPVFLAVLDWLVVRISAGPRSTADSGANSVVLIGLALLGAAAGVLLFITGRKYFSSEELILAGLALTCAWSWLIAFALPAGSYLLFWPLSLITTACLGIALLNSKRPVIVTLLGWGTAAAAALVFGPIAYLLYIFLTLQPITLLAVGMLIGFAFLLCVPFLEVAVPKAAWRMCTLILAAAGVAGIAGGIASSRPGASHPARDTLLYSLNADSGQAAWISYDKSLDAWTSKMFANKQVSRMPSPQYLGGWERPVLLSAAAPIDIVAPAADVNLEQQKGDKPGLRVKVRSNRKAPVTYLSFDPENGPVSVTIGQRTINFPQHAVRRLRLYGFASENVELELAFHSPSKTGFWLMDETFGLPVPIAPRPNGVIPGEGSDVTLVGRKYSF